MVINRKCIDKNFWRKYVIIEFFTGKQIYGRVNALRAGRGNARMELVDVHFVKQDGTMKPKSNRWKFSKSWVQIGNIKDISLCEG